MANYNQYHDPHFFLWSLIILSFRGMVIQNNPINLQSMAKFVDQFIFLNS